MLETVGHIIGFAAIVVFFISYQIFDKKKLIIVQTFATFMLCVQYLLIGAYSGFTLNAICIFRNILFYNRDKRFLSGAWVPILPAVVMTVVSLFSWDGYHSLFIVFGLVINTVCLGLCDSQGLRKSVLITSPLVLTYNVFELSYSGIISESFVFVSSAIGIIRYIKSVRLKKV